MVRGFRRYGRRRRTYPVRKRGGLKKYNKVRGSKFRMRMKSKRAAGKWKTFTYFTNIQPAHNIDAIRIVEILRGEAVTAFAAVAVAGAPNIKAFDQAARDEWFGAAAYGGGGAFGPHALDGFGNPTTLGTGLLSWINGKDVMMDHTRWDYSAYGITNTTIVQAWNRMNNVVGALVPIGMNHLFVKGVKVNVLGRDTGRPGLCFTAITKPDTPIKLTEQIGKCKIYAATTKQDPPVNIGGVNIRWKLPGLAVAGPAFSRVRVTIYYKLKGIIAA